MNDSDNVVGSPGIGFLQDELDAARHRVDYWKNQQKLAGKNAAEAEELVDSLAERRAKIALDAWHSSFPRLNWFIQSLKHARLAYFCACAMLRRRTFLKHQEHRWNQVSAQKDRDDFVQCRCRKGYRSNLGEES